MHHHLKGALLALGIFAGALGSAKADIINYHPCLDVPGQGFGGLACTVAGGDVFDFGGGDTYVVPNSGNDSQESLEAALRWVFGAEYPVLVGATDLEGDEMGFDFTPDDITNGSSFTVELEEAYTFATVKASTYFIIFDIRGLTSVTLATDDYIVNEVDNPNNGLLIIPVDVSHVGFWNATNTVPAPGGIGLLGLGLLGAGLLRQTRRS